MILDFLIYKLTENNHPELNIDKCINSLVKDGDCFVCKDSCPKNAVVIKDNKISFDENLCNQCGMCKVKCPTQAIRIKGEREYEIINDAGEKKNLVFACSLREAAGNLNVSCLNALHPELISALFVLYKDKKFYFNLSKCSNCKLANENSLFKDSLNSAISFVKKLGINPIFEIITEDNDISDLIVEEISRRNLFKLVKKESNNAVVKAINSITDDENNQFYYRNLLLRSIKDLQFEDEKNNSNIFWEYWDVNIDCNGCGKCVSVCPGKAWEIERNDTAIKINYKFINCYKCGLCEKICPKNSISKGNINNSERWRFNLKRELKLNTCKSCNKKFIAVCNEDDVCDICKKKELLRRKITIHN